MSSDKNVLNAANFNSPALSHVDWTLFLIPQVTAESVCPAFNPISGHRACPAVN